MPNWCRNIVTIDKESEHWNAFRELIKDGLSFNKIIPMPDELKGTRSPVHIINSNQKRAAYNRKNPGYEAISQEQSDELKRKYGADNWHSWAIQNFGCKWDVSPDDFHFTEDVNHLTMFFETAWSPPEGIFNKLNQDYPELIIEWEYQEPGAGFRGNFVTGEYEENWNPYEDS